ncbi:membrane protein [Marinomonas ushuaiensis DSM 15871]|uniref:Membrane protein n=1 Tax=Marinomonas ushuaiensis DSM 15871 TaxID=1122207 RepID=X7E3G5_9GAMM|nr:MAPEG family protein [Marinomonas ushuaiensis]ETX09718.1 membrane protein [Marinomonas ushuaiensis DSM 15871]
MQYVELIIITSVLQFFFFAVMTGKARIKYGIKAPAISGHEGFERMYRVQMNTLEMLVMFIPAIFIASNYWSTSLVSSLGLVYLVGRFIYWLAYVKDPASRTVGFMLSMLPSLALIILSIVGIIMSLAGIQA